MSEEIDSVSANNTHVRIEWVDRLRGWLIFLVVLGHVVGAGSHLSSGASSAWLSYVYKLIYSFHMPAFFVLAGITWSCGNQGFWMYFRRKILRLCVPYFFWGLVSAVLYVLLQDGVLEILKNGANDGYYLHKVHKSFWQPFVSLIHAGGWPNRTGFQCNSVLWFLPALFSIEMLFYFLAKVVNGKFMKVGIIIVLFLISFVSQQIKLCLPWGLNPALENMFYFVLGVFLSPWLKSIGNGSCAHILGGTLALCGVVYFMPWGSEVSNGLFWHGFFVAVAVAEIFMAIHWSVRIASQTLAWLGRASLTIMVTHKFVIVALQNYCGFISEGYGSAPLGVTALSLALSAAAILIGIIMHKLFLRFAPLLVGMKLHV